MAWEFNVTELLASREALQLTYPIVAPLIESILSGDFIGAINNFISGGGDWSVVGQLIGLGFKWGFITKAKNSLPFKKTFNFFGLEIKV